MRAGVSSRGPRRSPLVLQGDPPGPSAAETSAIKRSDKAAMFICGDRAARAERGVPCRRRDIPGGRREPHRQNNKTKAGGGRCRASRGALSRGPTGQGRGARETGNTERESHRRKGEPRGARGRTVRVVSEAADRSRDGRGGRPQPEKEKTGQECVDECAALRIVQRSVALISRG